MPFNSRDLWLVLKAQDQTNRALNSFSRNVRNAGNSVRMAQLQASRANAMGMMQQMRLNNAVDQAAVGQLRAQKATLLNAAAQGRMNGASSVYTDAIRRQVQALDTQINAHQRGIAAGNQAIVQQRIRLSQLDQEINRVNSYNKSLVEHEKNLAHLGGRMQSVAQTATAMGFAMSAAGVIGLVGLAKTIEVSVAYEKQVRHTATQIDNFSGNLIELGEVGRRVARQIAVPFMEIQPALFDIFSSMEVGMADAETLLIKFSKAAVAGQVSIQDVSRATIGLLNAFQRPVSDVNRLLDIQFQLIQEGIGTYEEWNQRIGLVTPSAVRAGQSIEMMMAALATSTRMGMSAARSGTAVARAFDAMSHPAAVKNMEQLGIKTRDANGRLLPFNQTLRQFRDVLMKMPEKDRVAAILDVFKGAGGTIEARRFIQNILLGAGNLELFDNILNEMNKSAGSLDKAYGLMSGSVAAKTQLLKNQWMLLKESIGKALIPVFATVVGWLANLMKKFDELSPRTKQVIAYALLAAAAFTAFMGPVILLVGGIAAFAAAFAIAGTAILVIIGILAALVIGLGLAVAAVLLAYKHSESFRKSVKELGENAEELWGILVNFAREVGDAWDKWLAPKLQKLWEVLDQQVLPALNDFWKKLNDEVIPRVKEAARIISDLVEKGFKWISSAIEHFVIPAIKKATEWWEKHRAEIEPILPVLAQVLKWILIIAAVLVGVLAVALLGPIVGAVLAVMAVFAALVVIFDKVILAFNFLIKAFLEKFGLIINGAAAAFGWIPGIGPKLKEAASKFNEFAAGVNIALAGIKDRDVAVRVKVTATDLNGKRVSIGEGMTIPRVGGFARGGLVRETGMYLVGERGRELLRLNRGDRVYNNTDTNNMLSLGERRFIQATGSSGQTQPVSQTFNITTQEIDPRKHSAELGFQLVGTM